MTFSIGYVQAELGFQPTAMCSRWVGRALRLFCPRIVLQCSSVPPSFPNTLWLNRQFIFSFLLLLFPSSCPWLMQRQTVRHANNFEYLIQVCSMIISRVAGVWLGFCLTELFVCIWYLIIILSTVNSIYNFHSTVQTLSNLSYLSPTTHILKWQFT